ncbi:MAG: TerC/Alx family metal homeostasis membrane protein [Kofleriaceae bacterium]
MNVPLWGWALLAGLVTLCLVVDLVAHRGDHVDSKKRALAWSLGWIGVAVGFGVFVTLWRGSESGEQWFAAYLLEKSLSVDNLFLFVVVFAALKIPSSEQRRVLTWGIVGALATRALFIFTGAELLERWHWVSYVFGGILVITALKLLGPEKEGPPKALTWISKWLPTTPERHGHHFLAKVNGKTVATPLMLALIAIELSDVLFAIDSIPAAFAITEDRFVLYSSNVFAILGLRALYVVLEHALERLRYLKYGLVLVLGFAGAKLLLASWIHIPPLVSVGVIAGVIGVVVLASSVGGRGRSRSRSTPEPSPAPHRATPVP